MSTAASVWPVRTRTPPSRATSGKTWPGETMSAGRAPSALLDQLDREEPARRTMLVSAMLANKDAVGFFAALSRPGLKVFTCPIANNENSFTPDALAAAARASGAGAEAHQGFEAAMKAAHAAGAERVLICGSLYLAGKVLAMNEEVPD